MINIVIDTKTVAKFESFESGKAFDWITQKGLFIENKIPLDGRILWMCKKLP